MPYRKNLELTANRDRPVSAGGPQYWRCLEEWAQTDEFRALVEREFPAQSSQWKDESSRREFLKLMGASLAFAGLGGCVRQPEEKIVPYVKQPEEVVPGKALYFATSMPHSDGALGLVVESHQGRPTKIEGNAEHPASLGAADAFAQAEILCLYDPDRSQTVLNGGEIDSWDRCLTSLSAQVERQKSKKGAGLRILTETVVSPSLARQLGAFLAQFTAARWYQYEPLNRDNSRAGARLAFGEDVDAQYRFDRADVILSLDSDFLIDGPGHVRHARDFMNRRRVLPKQTPTIEMCRLYVVESTPTVTGATADHRLPFRASRIEELAREIAARLGVHVNRPPADALHDVPPRWIDTLIDDLKNYRLKQGPGAALVIAGESQPPVVHALAHAMNEALKSGGKTVVYTDPIAARPDQQTARLRDLVREMRSGSVETLIILGGNPVFDAPAELEFDKALESVPYDLHLSRYVNETSALCQWHVPDSHFLETWSDTRAYDGTPSIVQPLIAPLYNSRSAHDVLAALLGNSGQTSHDVVQAHWKDHFNRIDFDDIWQHVLHDGLVRGERAAPKRVSLKHAFAKPGGREQAVSGARKESTEERPIEIVFRPDPTIGDGRYANNGWMQELPKPLTKLTWDNAALVGLATARLYGLENGDIVEVRRGARAVELPVWILAGHPDRSVTVHFGPGRTKVGRVGNGAGFNVYPLRTSDAMWFASDGALRKMERRYPLAATDKHHLTEGRELVRAGTVDDVRAKPQHPDFMVGAQGPPAEQSLFPPYEYTGYKWGMSVNMGACIGCNACVVACQSENNIPIVGKEQVIAGREMHWLRIDTYRQGRADPHEPPSIEAESANPRTYFQPVPCMHCENAPCELVCPVAATSHSDEGLNQMVYNRCVGTRYCSNNCPYKVRRFNFLEFTDYETPVLKLLNNPNVTVRTRGVMEKCTYCVQRINAARIESEKEGRPIRDGEVVTACQQACPTQAIVFGDLNQNNSRVKRQTEEPLDYALLAELNTRPRTTYLAAVRNPNPALADTQNSAGPRHA